MAECRQPLYLWLLAVFVLLAMSFLSSVHAASPRGCLAEMFITAGVPAVKAMTYARNLAGNKLQIANLRTTPAFRMRLIGIPNSGHAKAFHNCYSSSKRSPKCKAFKECSGRGLCKLSKPRRKSEVRVYQCKCAAGYSGSSCKKDACHKACQNGGSCKRTLRGDRFQCKCKPGYIGKRCEKTLNRCAPNPCANGGVCRPLHNDFSCTCKAGHAGKRCASHILTEKELDTKLGGVVKAIKESGEHQYIS